LEQDVLIRTASRESAGNPPMKCYLGVPGRAIDKNLLNLEAVAGQQLEDSLPPCGDRCGCCPPTAERVLAVKDILEF